MKEYRVFSTKGSWICTRETGDEAIAVARRNFPKFELGYIEQWECAHIMPVEWFLSLSDRAKAAESPANESDRRGSPSAGA